MTKLLESELRYRRLFETAQDGILILNARTGMIEDVNPYLIKMLGYSHEEFVKKKLWEVGAFKDIEASKDAFEVLQDKEYIRYEDLPLRTKDGRMIEVEFVSNVYLVGDEKVIQCDIRDITEHRRIIAALHVNENKYHELINQSPDGYFVIELSGNILTANQAMCKELEFSEEEFLSMNIWDIIPEQYLYQYRERLTKVLKGESLREATEYRVLGKTGGVHYVEVLAAPRYSGGDMIGFQGIARDITARKRAEEALSASEKLMRYIVRHDPNAIAVFDRNLHYIAVSNRYLQDYKVKEQDIIGKHHYEVLPEIPEKWKDVHRRCLAGAIERNDNDSFERPDGSIIYNRWECRPWHKENGDIGGIITYTEVTTERKRAEEALRKSEERFSQVWEVTSDAMALSDPEGIVLAANPAYLDLYGYTREQVIGRSFAIIFPEEYREQAVEQYRMVFAGEALPPTFESTIYRMDGTERIVESKATFLTRAGQRILMLSIIRDITERRQAEEQTRFQANLLNAVGQAVIATDAAGTVTYINRAAENLYGWRVEETRASTILDITVPQVSQIQAEEIMAYLSRGESWSGEFLVQNRDGRVFPAEVHDSPIFNKENELIGIIGISSDITERKHAEEKLREKERLLSEAQHIGHIGSWSYDLAADALQYSDEMYDLLDVSPQEFQHHQAGFLSLIYASDQLMVTRWMEDIKAGRQVKELDFRLFHKNGELRYLQTGGAVIFDSAGKPARFTGTAQDVSERKQAEIQIRQQIQRLTALSKIDQAIISTSNLSIMMETLLSQVLAQLQVDAAGVLLYNRDSQSLEYLLGSGFRTQAYESARVPVGKSLAGCVAKEQRPLKIDHLEDQPDDPFISGLVAKEGFVSYLGVPLITRGKVKGVLEIFQRAVLHPYAEWLDFLNTLAGQAAIAIENATLFTNLEKSNRELSQAYDATIEGWSRALDLRDKETEGHSSRVTELTLALAREFSFTKTQMLYIRWGALLHDIGKMGIPDNILHKPDTLSEEEWAIMRKHPQHAYDLLQPITFLTPALDIPYCHHEKWDGTGYPRGLKGEEIPLQARIFAVVDVWDALKSGRTYRAAWSEEKVREYISSLSGTQFDPQIVDTFMQLQN